MSISEELIESLILRGAIEFSGVDQRGELLFTFTEKIHDIAPAVYQVMLSMQTQDMNHLWINGFIDIDDVNIKDTTLHATSKAFDPEELKTLDANQVVILEQIIQLSKK
jgi:hypothetical protein